MSVAPDTAGDPLDARHLGPAVLARYIREHGLQAVKRLSQNFLADGEVLDAIVAEAQITPGRRVLEIGPGPGILTGALLAAGADVTAVEVDRRMVAHLRERFGAPGEGAGEVRAGGRLAGGRLRLVEGDALDEDLAALMTAPWDLVANLPYHITSPTLHHVLGAEPRPERFVLMLQREVAERIAAPPGGLSYLAVFVQYHARVRVARVVPPQAFEPAPEVASALLIGETRARRLDPVAEEDLWRLVQAGFRERRKMLHNVLPRQLPAVARATLVAALEREGIAPERRPQTLSVEEWLGLAAALGPLP